MGRWIEELGWIARSVRFFSRIRHRCPLGRAAKGSRGPFGRHCRRGSWRWNSKTTKSKARAGKRKKMGMGERASVGGQRRRSENSATHEAEAFPPTHEAGAFPPSQLVLFHYSIDCRLHSVNKKRPYLLTAVQAILQFLFVLKSHEVSSQRFFI